MQGSRQAVLFASAGESSLWKVVQGLRPTVSLVAGSLQSVSCVAPRFAVRRHVRKVMQGRRQLSSRLPRCVRVPFACSGRSLPPPLLRYSRPLVWGVGQGRVARFSGVGTRRRTSNLSVGQVVAIGSCSFSLPQRVVSRPLASGFR